MTFDTPRHPKCGRQIAAVLNLLNRNDEGARSGIRNVQRYNRVQMTKLVLQRTSHGKDVGRQHKRHTYNSEALR